MAYLRTNARREKREQESFSRSRESLFIDFPQRDEPVQYSVPITHRRKRVARRDLTPYNEIMLLVWAVIEYRSKPYFERLLAEVCRGMNEDVVRDLVMLSTLQQEAA